MTDEVFSLPKIQMNHMAFFPHLSFRNLVHRQEKRRRCSSSFAHALSCTCRHKRHVAATLSQWKDRVSGRRFPRLRLSREKRDIPDREEQGPVDKISHACQRRSGVCHCTGSDVPKRGRRGEHCDGVCLRFARCVGRSTRRTKTGNGSGSIWPSG